MKNLVKNIWKIAAMSSIFGIILIVSGLAMGASKSMYLDSTGVHVFNLKKYKTISELNTGKFTNLDIITNLSNVEFIKSDKYGFEIKYYEDNAPTWNLKDGKLEINSKEKDIGNYINFGFDFKNSDDIYVKIFLPQDAAFDSMRINVDIGNIKIGNFSSKIINVENSVGQLLISNAKIDNFNAKSSNGKIELDNCTISDSTISNNTGQVIGKNLKSSNLNIVADIGNIDVQGEFIGKTKLHSDVGKVTLITSKNKEFYNYDFYTEIGKIEIDNKKEERKSNYKSEKGLENSIEITTNTGNILVNFSK